MNDIEMLFERYVARIYSLAYHYLGNTAAAEDAVQETFLRVLQKQSGFQHHSRLTTWLYRIAINVCLDQLRSQQRRQHGELYPDFEIRSNDEPGQDLEKRELAAAVRDVVQALEPDLKLLVILRDWEDLSYQEIARVTGLSIGTISSRLNRARRIIHRELRQTGGIVR